MQVHEVGRKLPHIRRYLAGLTTRSLLIYAGRGLAIGVGAASVFLAVSSGLTGPVASAVQARLVLVVGLALLLGATWLVARPVRGVFGLGACKLLADTDPLLSSRAQTVLELAQGSVGFSPALVEANASAVATQLSNVDRSEVVPWRQLQHWSVGWGLTALLIALLSWQLSPGVRVGAHALLHPASEDAEGVRTAAVVDRARLRLTYPGYLRRAPAELDTPSRVEAPVGTTVEVAVQFRLPGQSARMKIGGSNIRMARAENGEHVGRFVVRETGAIRVQLRSDGRWYQDVAQPLVRAVLDRAPVVELQQPTSNQVLRANQLLPLRIAAQDDVGLERLEAVAQLSDGGQVRRRLWAPQGDADLLTRLEHQASLSAQDLGIAEGQRARLWIEAVDGDLVSGPNVGVSNSIQVEVGTLATELSSRIPQLHGLLDGLLALLADRLELDLPQAPHAAVQRFQRLERPTRAWLSDLAVTLAGWEEASEGTGGDRASLRAIQQRMRSLMDAEAGLYAVNVGALPVRKRADEKVIKHQERSTITINDLLAATLVEEARALTEELRDLRDHIAELLGQLQDEDNKAAKDAIMDEIARAQERLQRLAQSLAQVSARVPSEFINEEALPQEGAGDNLQQLREAFAKDDFQEAAEQLAQLAMKLEKMAQDIQEGGLRFREARHGEQDAAGMEARRRIGELANEQAGLAESSFGVARQASQRSDSQAGSTQGLERRAEQAQRAMDGLGESSLGAQEGRTFDAAQRRLADAQDALQTGDVGEARRMAEAASRSMDQLATELDTQSQMFPGHGGKTSKNARLAEQAAKRLEALRDELRRRSQRAQENLTDGERASLKDTMERQRQTRNATEALREQLGEDGNMPMTPDLDGALRDASGAMSRAEQALRQGDPQSANLAQDEATERLQQAAEQLAQQGQPSAGEPGQDGQPGETGEREGNAAGREHRGPVRIPGEEDFAAPKEMRRKLLDAMREPAPRGYEARNHRYFRELLR